MNRLEKILDRITVMVEENKSIDKIEEALFGGDDIQEEETGSAFEEYSSHENRLATDILNEVE